MMKNRKNDWCIFRDGHRERITEYYFFRHGSDKDTILMIEFYTKSGAYRYVESIEEILVVTPPPKKYLLPNPRARATRFEKWREVKIETSLGILDDSHYVICHDIDRIELRR